LSWLEASRAGATVIGQDRGRSEEQYEQGGDYLDACAESFGDVLSIHRHKRNCRMRASTLAMFSSFVHRLGSLFFTISRIPDLKSSADTLSTFEVNEEATCGTEDSDRKNSRQARNSLTVSSRDCDNGVEIEHESSSNAQLGPRERAKMMWRQTMNAVTSRIRTGARANDISHHFTDFGSSAITAAAAAATSQKKLINSSSSSCLNAEKPTGLTLNVHGEREIFGTRGSFVYLWLYQMSYHFVSMTFSPSRRLTDGEHMGLAHSPSARSKCSHLRTQSYKGKSNCLKSDEVGASELVVERKRRRKAAAVEVAVLSWSNVDDERTKRPKKTRTRF
jgi:hypothetical protein